MKELTGSALLPRDAEVSTRKPIPKMVLIPREVSLHHMVSRVIPAFDVYGDVFRLVLPLPLNIFCLRKPDHIKAVSTLKESATTKPDMIPKADFFMGNGLFNDLGGSTWRAKRLVLKDSFTEAMALKSSEHLPHSFEKMKSRWTEFATSSPIDLYAELQRMVLDYAADALFSERLSAEQLDWIVPATNFAEKMFVTLTPHWIPTPSNLKFRRVKNEYHRFMDEIIRKHRQAPNSYKDMVSHLIDEPSQVTNSPHTDSEIKAEMFSVYFGTPALALTLLWGVFFLFSRPEILSKVRGELKSVIGDRAPRGEDLTNLPYLEMFVKEVFRLYPSFWGSLRYAADPVEFDGYSFPAKSIFAMMRFAAQRLPDHWENPDRFIPERHASRNACPHALLPFGLGQRLCIGRSLATMICPLVIASIAQSFNIHLQSDLQSDKIELKYGLGLYPAKTIFGTIQPVRV